jgi:type I restriction enzyme, S subunit
VSFARYAEYKDSGLAWLGEVPAHWDVQRIKNTTYLKGRVGWKGLTSEEYLEEGYAYLVTGTDFSKRFISWSECHCVERDRYEDDPFIQLKNGDLLITKDGTIGKLALVKELDRPACLNSGIFLVRPKSSYITEYMYWVLSSPAFAVFCDLSSVGSTIQHLYQNVFERFSFPIPTSEEQYSIAAFLDREAAKIDALVAEQEKLITLLKEKRQAVISHAVAKGLDPNVPMKDSGIEWLGEVPAQWDVKQIRHFSEVLRGKFTHRPRNDPAFYDGTYPFIQTGDITCSSRFITEYKQTLNERGISVSKEFPRGTLVMAIAANIGDVAILDFPAYFPDSIVGLVPNAKTDLMFLFYLMMALKQPMLMTATVSTQMNLNVDQIVSLVAACPPLNEQVWIVSFLDRETAKIDALTSEAKSAIELLKERRSALISAAVTGKIDVRGLAGQTESTSHEMAGSPA